MILIFLSYSLFSFSSGKENEGKERFFSSTDSLNTELLSIRNTEKSLSDSIYYLNQEILKDPENEELLKKLGNLQVKFKLMEEAFLTYSRLIGINAENPEACLFFGHYYYLKGKKKLHMEDRNFSKITHPKKMEYATYQNNIKKILMEEYTKAIQYLEISQKSKSSPNVDKILEEMNFRISHPDPLKK
ncbi:MAG: hypothetical protein LUG18_05310 [Candidatus Azobacteroides sp.]|nr:hypothetical protein [Candidatus Azobacteroides sp.]